LVEQNPVDNIDLRDKHFLRHWCHRLEWVKKLHLYNNTQLNIVQMGNLIPEIDSNNQQDKPCIVKQWINLFDYCIDPQHMKTRLYYPVDSNIPEDR